MGWKQKYFVLGVALAAEVWGMSPTAETQQPPPAFTSTAKKTSPATIALSTTTTRVSVPDKPRSTTSTTVSQSPPELTDEQYANKAYISSYFIPRLVEAGITIVPPINEDIAFVNAFNEFIVTKDGIYGIQFYIENLSDTREKIILFDSAGPASVLSNGLSYVDGVYYETYSQMIHQESGSTRDGGNIRDTTGGQAFEPYTDQGIQNAILFIELTFQDLASGTGVTNR